ncbi:MAG: hypothetical protein NTY75_04940 [Candidatus Shapirobacteria bacterium]|nr:hypothetical protein [Candidatus Shapirobacteria bacterium]
MIGVIEAFTDTGAALSDITKNPATLFRQHLSRNTELVLEVASRMTFPRSKEFFPETFRQISNLIYYANNYFDLGLTARQQLFQNKPFEFVALMTVFGETKINMDKAANEPIRKN